MANISNLSTRPYFKGSIFSLPDMHYLWKQSYRYLVTYKATSSILQEYITHVKVKIEKLQIKVL